MCTPKELKEQKYSGVVVVSTLDNLSTPDSELSQATVSGITHQNHFQAPLVQFCQTHIPTSSINIPRIQTTVSSDVQPTQTVVSMANFQAQLDLSFDSEEEIDFPTVEAKLHMRTLHLKRQLKEVKTIQINRER